MTAIELGLMSPEIKNLELFREYPKKAKKISKNSKTTTVNENLKPQIELYAINNGINYKTFKTQEQRDEFFTNYAGSFIKRFLFGYIGDYQGKKDVWKVENVDEIEDVRYLQIVDSTLSYVYNNRVDIWDRCRTDLGTLPTDTKEAQEKLLEKAI